jgi:hypothetical protein
MAKWGNSRHKIRVLKRNNVGLGEMISKEHEQRGTSPSIKLYAYTPCRNVAMIGQLHAPFILLNSKKARFCLWIGWVCFRCVLENVEKKELACLLHPTNRSLTNVPTTLSRLSVKSKTLKFRRFVLHESWTAVLTFWHRSFIFNSNKSPTRCNCFSVYYPDVCLQLNMFWALSSKQTSG